MLEMINLLEIIFLISFIKGYLYDMKCPTGQYGDTPNCDFCLPYCSTCPTKDYCIACFAMPYHLGKTCDEFKRHIIAKKCSFCNSKLSFH